MQQNYDSDCLFKFDGMSQDTSHAGRIIKEDCELMQWLKKKRSLEQAVIQSQFWKQWVVVCRI